MSDLADRDRVVKRGWARPGGVHDWIVRLLKIVLPLGVGVLLAYLLLSPLSEKKEVSFLLDKKKVETTKERMRVEGAQYRGVDNRGRPFVLDAKTAVQAKSDDPVVQITGMTAGIELADGPASITAERARYDMDRQQVEVLGPILFKAFDGYKLETRDVQVDLARQFLNGSNGVEGSMPLGRFSAQRMEVSLPDRRVVLTGRARLHIVQGALR
jgi:lipopolysaccharide export system protein LptC